MARNVEAVWQHYLHEEKSKTASQLAQLSMAQKKLMVFIASGQTQALAAQATLSKLSLPSASVVKVLKSLVVSDCIYEVQGHGYQITDPLIASSIRMFFPSDEWLLIGLITNIFHIQTLLWRHGVSCNSDYRPAIIRINAFF